MHAFLTLALVGGELSS